MDVDDLDVRACWAGDAVYSIAIGAYMFWLRDVTRLCVTELMTVGLGWSMVQPELSWIVAILCITVLALPLWLCAPYNL